MSGYDYDADPYFDTKPLSGETIRNEPPEPPPVEEEDLAKLELYDHASQAITRFERDFFRERWFSTEQGLLHFAWEAVKTLDEHDIETPIKALPRELYLLDHFNNLIKYDTYVVLKSRQIMITWATFIYLVWETMRLPYRKIGLVPKKSDDGKDHIEDRIHAFVWQHLPQWLKDDFPEPSLNRGEFRLNHHPLPVRWAPQYNPEDGWLSWLASFEKGPHQLRQYTLSHIFWDEMAFQEHARKAWQAAIPTIGKRKKGSGGKVIAVSTMLPGSFHDILCGVNRGSTQMVDNAVEISLGTMKPPESGFYKNPIPGVVHFWNHTYGAFVAVYSFKADSEKRNPLWEQEESLRLGGTSSPEWLLDYRMQRQAFRGILVYPHFNVDWNVVPARAVNRECEIFLSFDFGHTVPTAVLFWEWNETEQTLTCFDEIYITTASQGSIKLMIEQQLSIHLGIPKGEVVLSELLGDNVGDPNSPGLMLEYAQEPSGLLIRGNLPGDSGQKPWRINDRPTGEARLDTALRPSFICCGVRQYAMDGKVEAECQGILVDEAGNKRQCGKPYTARPMLVIMEGRAPALVRELPLQQRIDANDPGLEPAERNKKGIPDHATDSARYAVMRYQNFMGLEKLEVPRPKWATETNPDKLSLLEKLNRERLELVAQSEAYRGAIEEVGQIEYDGAEEWE